MVKFNLELSSNNIFGSFSFSIVHVELKKQICLHGYKIKRIIAVSENSKSEMYKCTHFLCLDGVQWILSQFLGGSRGGTLCSASELSPWAV